MPGPATAATDDNDNGMAGGLMVLHKKPVPIATMVLFATLFGSNKIYPAQGPATAEMNRGLVEVIAGTTDDTSLRMTEDLANLLDDATRRVLPVVGRGSLQNVADLKALRGIDMAIIQTDVLDRVKAQNPAQTITYITKLYNEEFHLVARAGIASLDDLADKKVNFGTAGDGAAVTAAAIFERVGIKVQPTSYLPSVALNKLRSGDIDAMAFVAAKPAPLLWSVRREGGLHLLGVPPKSGVIGVYVPATLSADDYPELVPAGQPVETVSVGTALMVANLVQGSERARNVASFVEAFFTQLPRLQEPGHLAKWQEVNISAELPGWKRFEPAEAWLKRYTVASSGPTRPPAAVNEKELRDIFFRFLDERNRAAGTATLSAQQKDEMFQQFRAWQSNAPR